MAQGDIVWFDQGLVDLGKKLHDLNADEFKLALTDGTTTPLVTTADPRWGAGGTTNFAAEEVTPGGTYSAGGIIVPSTSFILTGGLGKFSGDNISWTQNVSNPTDATWAILYNNTDADKRCLLFIDIGGAFDMRTGPLIVNWNALGIMLLNQA